MMTQSIKIQDIVNELDLDVLTGTDLKRSISGGYASDLLSCVIAGAQPDNVWVTLQAHPNVIAVASLANLAAVIITEGVTPDEQTVQKAREQEICLLTTPKTTFTVVGELSALGIGGS